MTREELEELWRRREVDRFREEIDRLPLDERFRILHELGVYHSAESQSGAGSSYAETATLRAALPGLLARLGVRSMLDVPCGDFHWMREVPLGDVRYVGADIVPELVGRNREAAPAGCEFVVLDLTRNPLPEVDLVMSRDLFIHLSLADVARALENILRSSARWLLATHYELCARNTEIVSGDFHPVNLCLPPFRLANPVEVIREDSAMEGGRYFDRAMALWELDPLRAGGVPERLGRLERALRTSV